MPGRQRPDCRDVIVQSQGQLLQVVGALDAACCLASRLDRRQQQGDQHGNDGDDDQKFNQCETATLLSWK